MKNTSLSIALIALALPFSACVMMDGTPKKHPLQAAVLREDAKDAHKTQVTLYTLNPYRSFLGEARESETFYGYGVMGKAAITASADKQMLLDALASGIEYSRDSAHVCFKPRHGLHVVSGGQTTDYVICFQCLRMKVYRDDTQENVLISNTPARAYVSAVKKYNITPPPE